MTIEANGILESLGHMFHTVPGSNIHRLFSPYLAWLGEVQAGLEEILASRYLETATARSLDLLGAGIALGRLAGESDEAYRKRLRLEIKILCSQSTLEEIRAILSEGLGIPPDAILIYNNASPSQGLTDLPYFCEISLNHGALLLNEASRLFKFSDDYDAPAYESPRGFNVGKWRRTRNITREQMILEIVALIERILGTGVQYLIAAHGGFKFSDVYDTPAYESNRGFDRGRWRRAV